MVKVQLESGRRKVDAEKRAKLETAGFRVGTSSEFLEISPEEDEVIELLLVLDGDLRLRRRQPDAGDRAATTGARE